LQGACQSAADAARALLLLLIETAKLSPMERRVVLRDLESRDGLASSRELGQEFAVSAGSIRSYRSRALKKLRATAASVDGDGGFKRITRSEAGSSTDSRHG